MRGEVVLLENFVNAENKRFSEVYFRTETTENARVGRSLFSHNKRTASIASRQIVEQIDELSLEQLAQAINKSSSSNSSPTLEANNVLLFKLRKIFFKALPSYRKNIANILKRAWLSKLNQTAFDLQNGLRLEVRIYEISNFMTFDNQETFGFKYTIAINGQDPKFLGIQEPTFEDYIRETGFEQKPGIVFCPCHTFEIDRLYVDSTQPEIQKVLQNVWLYSNRFKQASGRSIAPVMLENRIQLKSKLDTDFYDANMQNLSRLAVSWLVDDSELNPVFFNRPSIKEITQLLAESNVKVFTDIPYVKKHIDILESQQQLTNSIKAAIRSAWSLANPILDKDIFSVFLEYEDGDVKGDQQFFARSLNQYNFSTAHNFNGSSIHVRQKWREDGSHLKGLNYFIGVDGVNFDVNDLKQPDTESIKRSLKAVLPDVKFYSDMVGGLQQESEATSKKLMMTIIVSAVGGFAFIMLVVIVVSIVMRR